MQNLLFFQGFLLSLSLIMAIGAQNIFVIKQVIAKNNIFFVCLVCFLCDFVLMFAGIFGVGKIFASNKFLSIFMALAGIVFVLFYGIMSLISAFKDKTSLGFQAQNLRFSIPKTIALTLGITLLNPHVYLDTVFIIGASALTLGFEQKIIFAIGCVSASFLWFFGLGYGAFWLSPLLSRPKTAKFIDIFTAVIMFLVAFGLIKFLIAL